MKKYIIKRLLWSVLILFIVAFLLYILMRSLPTSYLEQIARQKSQQPGSKTFEEWMQQLEATYGMDKGIVPGFFAWLSKAVRGDFGDSWKYTVPVTRKFTEVVGISFWMGLIVMVLEMLISIPLGIIAATKQYSATDNAISILALAGISLPTFFTASLLKLIFSVKLGWFDLNGLVGRNYDFLSPMGQRMDVAMHLVLPIITLLIASIGAYMRYIRTNMLEVLSSDYIRTARAKGLSERRVIAAGSVFGCHDYGAAFLYPRYRIHFLSGYDFRRHSVLHVLPGIYCSVDFGRELNYRYFIRGC